MTDDLIERAKAAHAQRWEAPGPAYRDPVPTGVVELGDWASEHLPELVAEVDLWMFRAGQAHCNLQLCEISRDESRAEVERLRGALESVVRQWRSGEIQGAGYSLQCIEAVLRGDQ